MKAPVRSETMDKCKYLPIGLECLTTLMPIKLKAKKVKTTVGKSILIFIFHKKKLNNASINKAITI